MAKLSQQLAIAVKKRAFANISTGKIRNTAEFVGQLAIEIMRNRIDAGYDVNGQQFRKLTRRYRRFKRRFINREIKVKGSKRPNNTIKRLLKNTTIYRAKSVTDYIRLTGRMMSGFRFNVQKADIVNDNVRIIVRYYIDKKFMKQADGVSKKRDFFGLSKSGKFRQKEQNLIFNTVLKQLGSKVLREGALQIK